MTKTISVNEYNAALAKAMPEAELQEHVRSTCVKLGHLFYHPWRSDNSASGFPDCTIVTTDGRLIFAELKKQNKEPTPAQWDWIEGLRSVDATVYVWKPLEWLDGTIEEILKGANQS